MDQLFAQLSNVLSGDQSRMLQTTSGVYALAAFALFVSALTVVTWLCLTDRPLAPHRGHGIF